MREFFAYRIQDKEGVCSLIHNSKRLFQQFLVDAYTMIETERLSFIRGHQKELHCESFEKLKQLKGSRYLLCQVWVQRSYYHHLL